MAESYVSTILAGCDSETEQKSRRGNGDESYFERQQICTLTIVVRMHLRLLSVHPAVVTSIAMTRPMGWKLL